MQGWREAVGKARVDAYFVAADVDGLPGVLAQQTASAPVVAYLCRGTSCDPPLTSHDAFAAALRRLAH
jgi:ABC-type xylose transport system substrate-binding protein